MTRTIRAYTYRGRHHVRKPSRQWSLSLAPLTRLGNALAPAWYAVRDGATTWGLLLVAVVLVATLVSQAPSSPAPAPQPVVSSSPQVVTLPTPFPVETTR